jgi:hypothetical protein
MVLAGPRADPARRAGKRGRVVKPPPPGPVMRVDGAREVSAVAMRGAHRMPGAFEDAEDGTLRARAIIGRDLPSSNAVRHLRARRTMGTGEGPTPFLSGSTAAGADRNSPQP